MPGLRPNASFWGRVSSVGTSPVPSGFHVFWENFILHQHGNVRSASLSGCYNLFPMEQNETPPNTAHPPKLEFFSPGGREKLSQKQANEENRIKNGKNWGSSATCRNTGTGTFITEPRLLGTFSS